MDEDRILVNGLKGQAIDLLVLILSYSKRLEVFKQRYLGFITEYASSYGA